MAGFKVRQKAKAYSYRKRHLALTSHEQVQSRRIKKFILALMVKQKQEEKIQQLDSSREELFESVLKVLAARYLSIVCVGASFTFFPHFGCQLQYHPVLSSMSY
jgi:hypothetical protein